MSYPYSHREGSKEWVVSRCINCGSKFELLYDDETATCFVLKSCICGECID